MDLSINRTFSTKNAEWLIHILIWSFLIAERWVNHFPLVENPLYGFYQTLMIVLTIMAPIYINAFVLIPRYLKKSSWFRYLILLVLLILSANITRGLLAVLYFQLSGISYDFTTEFFKWAFIDYTSLDKFIFGPTSWILCFSFIYRLVKDWVINERITSQLKLEKTAMELAFLRSQINPHFLFNTLNNLYAVALEEKAQRTADGVAKVGTLMRYSLHDSQTDRILLQKEIEYIEKYIELQQLRIVDETNVDIRTTLDVHDMGATKIAPMILIPFIENAFKYGISTVHKSFISIHIKLEEDILKLRIENTVNEKMREDKEDEGGIGLKNVRNRLQLIYPKRFHLECHKTDARYFVDLSLELKE